MAQALQTAVNLLLFCCFCFFLDRERLKARTVAQDRLLSGIVCHRRGKTEGESDSWIARTVAQDRSFLSGFVWHGCVRWGSRKPCPDTLLMAPSALPVFKRQRGLVVHPPEMLLCSSVGEAWRTLKNHLILWIASIAAVKGLPYVGRPPLSFGRDIFPAVCTCTKQSSTMLPSFGNGMERGGGSVFRGKGTTSNPQKS